MDVADVRNPANAGVDIVVLVDGVEVGRGSLFPPDQPAAFRFPLSTTAERIAVEVRVDSTSRDVSLTVAVGVRGRAG